MIKNIVGSRRRLGSWLLALPFIVATSGSATAQTGEMPPPPVSVLTLQEKTIPVTSVLPGRIAATRVSEVRARVSGILQERVFQQGALVQKDDILFRIDPKLYRVHVASAEATLQRAIATQTNARQQLERKKALRDRQIASGVDFETAEVTLAQADADVALAEASLEEAKINLDYTDVRAPITGVIGGALVTEGALVTAHGSQNLALIQQIDPVYADFTQSSAEVLALKRAIESGKLESSTPGEARVELYFDDGTVYPIPGRLLFANASVDASTGQVTLRAEFPNPNRDLLPGLYVRVRVEQAVRQGGITIPQKAVMRKANGDAYAYVVEGDTASMRDIKLGQTNGSDWIVESGLQNGEQVIVDGLQKVQPGGKVVPQALTPADQDEQGSKPPATKAK